MAVEAKVIEHVKNILHHFGDKYFVNNIRLKKNRIIEDLNRYDTNLMTALLSDKLIHDTYTEKISGYEIFKLNQFISMLEFKKYWEDSYTKYSNKIGLTSEGRFIDESNDVVLDFPFKDTVLKAGMTKEDLDNENNTDEPFLNEILAKPEIDELFEPKIFINTHKYEFNKGLNIKKMSNENNLVVKGNNLIVLHSLRARYRGKVKLIYLDPPFNTGSDSFDYNDRFTHSSWLTFMKNRLEVAREFLTDDGVIAVHIDDSEAPYLRVLMDSIFERNSYLFTQYILVRYSNKTLKSDMDYHKQIEQIFFYKKAPKSVVNPIKDKEDYDYSKFIYSFEELGEPIDTIQLGGKRVDVFNNENIRLNKHEPSKNGLKEIWASGTILDGNSSGRFFRDYLSGRYQNDGYEVVYKVWGIGDDGNSFRYFTGPKRKGATKGKYYQGVPNDVKIGKTTTKLKPVDGFLDLTGSFGNDRNEEW